MNSELRYCINCLMTQGRARALRESGGQWICDTSGGCKSQYTDHYLSHVRQSIERLLVSLDVKPSEIITAGSRAERVYESIASGERSVILPDEDDEKS